METPTPLFILKNLVFQHHMSPMKIGTDALLLGAYTKKIGDKSKILEIGSGCGIISIMTARLHPNIHITCLDIDQKACIECQTNLALNKLTNRSEVICSDLNKLGDEFLKFDIIISNPPFFTSQMKPNEPKSTRAKHTTDLTLNQLSDAVAKLLLYEGKFYVILPVDEGKLLKDYLEKYGIFLTEKVEIKSLNDKEVFRNILVFEKTMSPSDLILKQLTLYNSTQRNDWSEDYKQLLQDFKNFN